MGQLPKSPLYSRFISVYISVSSSHSLLFIVADVFRFIFFLDNIWNKKYYNISRPWLPRKQQFSRLIRRPTADNMITWYGDFFLRTHHHHRTWKPVFFRQLLPALISMLIDYVMNNIFMTDLRLVLTDTCFTISSLSKKEKEKKTGTQISSSVLVYFFAFI